MLLGLDNIVSDISTRLSQMRSENKRKDLIKKRKDLINGFIFDLFISYVISNIKKKFTNDDESIYPPGYLMDGVVNGWNASWNFHQPIQLIHVAAKAGRIDVVRALIESGANIHAKTKDGETTLHFAARAGNLEIVKLLVEKGCDCNAVNQHGETPLMIASSYTYSKKREAVVGYLSERGAANTQSIPSMYEPVIKRQRMNSFVKEVELLSLLSQKGIPPEIGEMITEKAGTPAFLHQRDNAQKAIKTANNTLQKREEKRELERCVPDNEDEKARNEEEAQRYDETGEWSFGF